ncbi:MAG: YtxH domain-containing protein [Candidatus Margulisiibacteriota bacterium]
MADRKDSFFGGLLIGSIIGGAAAFLLTPFTGDEARKKLKEKIGEFKEGDPERTEKIKASGQEVISNTIASIEEGIQKIALAIDEAKKASDEKRQELEGENK